MCSKYSGGGGFIYTLCVSVLLVVSLCCCSGQQTAELTLDSADQQLDALTTRVLDLTNRLDATMKKRVDAEFAVGHLSWKLDEMSGAVNNA